MLGLREKLEKEISLSKLSMESVASPSDLSLADLSDDDEDSPLLLASKSSPMPISSPSLQVGFDGEGDGHTLRSLQTSHLSPIRRSFGNHQFNCTTLETPPSVTTSSYDAFFSGFEKDASSPPDKKCSKHYTLQQELLLSEKIAEMNEPDAKKLLAKVLVDNLGLRKELTNKEKHIKAYKGQMLAILDWKVREETEGLGLSKSDFDASPSKGRDQKFGGGSGLSKTKLNESEEDSTDVEEVNAPARNVHEIRMVEEVYGVRRSLSFIQEFASSIEVDQELLRSRIKGGCYLTNQLLVGGVSGWMSATFMKKFGKIALSAVGGGLILLVYSARKGYVNVNYDSIYQEISRLCEEQTELDFDHDDGEEEDSEQSNSPSDDRSLLGKSESRGIVPSSDSWGIEKVKTARKWISSHTYTVGGFVLTFIYNMV